MTGYALGFVASCFVGMFVAGVISDWLNRREARRAEAVRLDGYTRTPTTDEQQERADIAKARRAAAEAYMRWPA